jgi:shikimate kinase
MPSLKNIILIGMPAVGKSTVGVLLAKRLGMAFLDTDIYIQTYEKKHLQDILDREGIHGFCVLEERHILSIDCEGHVIATGGSVVYSAQAMQHLRAAGIVVFMELGPEKLEQRLADIHARGVLRAPGQSIAGLYRERKPLYAKYSDITIDCGGRTPDQTVMAITAKIKLFQERQNRSLDV